MSVVGNGLRSDKLHCVVFSMKQHMRFTNAKVVSPDTGVLKNSAAIHSELGPVQEEFVGIGYNVLNGVQAGRLQLKIFKPRGGTHNGKDTFRELLELWKEQQYCSIEDSPDDYVWVDSPGEILLYDYPRLDDRPLPRFRFGLFGNTVPERGNCSPWIFWARRPRLLDQVRERTIPDFEDRAIVSIFLGRIEKNRIQKRNRKRFNWSKAGIEVFSCPKAKSTTPYPYSKQEYLELLLQSKFGLCLPGYGPKCNREIELLGTGVVPIFTPGVDNSYFEPLIEGLHFLRVNHPRGVKERIESVSKEAWRMMHNAGSDWYERNASVRGSFETTLKIVDALR